MISASEAAERQRRGRIQRLKSYHERALNRIEQAISEATANGEGEARVMVAENLIFHSNNDLGWYLTQVLKYRVRLGMIDQRTRSNLIVITW